MQSVAHDRLALRRRAASLFPFPAGARFETQYLPRRAAMNTGWAAALLLMSGTVALAQDFRCDQDQSIEEVRKLTAAKTIVSVDVFLPNVTVVVDERAWQRSDVPTKKAMAQNVDCATGGANNRMLHSIFFRSGKSNAQLGEFSGNELKLP
jgi:hypothetical protein